MNIEYPTVYYTLKTVYVLQMMQNINMGGNPQQPIGNFKHAQCVIRLRTLSPLQNIFPTLKCMT
jgi:hypothetical protein